MSGSWRRRLGVAGAALVVALGGALAAYLSTPRTTADGDWAAPFVAGRVAGHALVSGDNSALDLRTGRRVTLGSVTGGRPFVGDGRLVVASSGRLDVAKLDATGRWTWRAPAGADALPVAARDGTTIVAVCGGGPDGTCDLVGLDGRGREAWRVGSPAHVPAPQSPTLPRVLVLPVPGGGVQVTDPASGRQTLQPGTSAATAPDGRVVVPAVQGGQCVVSAFDGPDPLWVEVLGGCPVGAAVEVGFDATSASVRMPDRTLRLDLDTGRRLDLDDTTYPSDTRASAGTLAVVRRTQSTPLNPLRWGKPTTVLTVVDTAGAIELGTVAATGPLDVLLVDATGLVVREGARIVRYDLAGTG